MQIDGLKMLEGSEIQNLTVDSGSSFPLTPNKAELFYLDTATDTIQIGLYCYSGLDWLLVGQSSIGNASIESGLDFPTQPKDAALFYKLSGDVGLYIYLDIDQTWHNVGNSNLSIAAISGAYSDIINAPTNLSQFNNDSNFQTLTQVNTAIQAIVDTAPEALNTLKEIADQLTNNESAETALTTTLAGKANTADLSTAAFSGEYADVLNTPIEKTKLSEFINDSNFVTNAAVVTAVNTEKQRAQIAETSINASVAAEIIRAAQVESSLADRLTALDGGGADAGLSVVAKTGNYNDLLNLPTIPTAVSELTNDLQFQTLTDVNNAITTLQTSIDGKANKSSSLAGYGITDAYTAAVTQSKLDSKSDKHDSLTGYGILDGVYANQLGIASTETKIGVATLDSLGKITATQLPTNLATLDSNGKVPSTQLPSYVDDVKEYANLAAFPVTLITGAETGKIYVAQDTGMIYRWTGTAYVEISSAGIADAALKLFTPRTISLSGAASGSIAFDGTQDVSIDVTLPNYYTKSEIGTNNYTKTEVDNSLSTKVAKTQLGIASTTDITGVATLDNMGKIVDTQLPDFVNDVVEYDNLGAFPINNISGAVSGKLYVALDTNLLYRWNGTGYTEVSSAGIVTSAAALSVARTISLSGSAAGSVSFDGTKDVSINVTLPNYYSKTEIDTNFYTKSESDTNLNTAINTLVLNTQVGAASGVAGLDENAKVPFSQLPSTIATKDVLTGKIPFEQLPANLATLDSNGIVPSEQLPSYVDDVLEYANLTLFPTIDGAEAGKIYIAQDTGLIYRWSGSTYVEISSAGTAEVATRLYTPRTISLTGNATGSASFDGSSNISINVSLPNTYSKLESDGKYALISNVYSKTDADSKFALKTAVYTKDDVYSKTEADSAFILKTDSYTKSEVNDALASKSNKFTTLTGYGIIDAVNVSQLGIASTDSVDGVPGVTGVATLGTNGIIPSSQLPFIPTKTSDLINDMDYQTGIQVQDSIQSLTGISSSIVSDLVTLGSQMTASEANLSTLATSVNAKADRATSLAGYGITDAYDKDHSYSSTQIDNKLNLKANASDVYTQSQVDSLLTGKVDSGTKLADYGITDAVYSNQLGVASTETKTGVATLDSNGLVPSSQLPSYVDDVLEYANLAAFPTNGDSGKIYVTLDSNRIYRWSGTSYVEVSSAGVADTAIKLQTARTITLTGAASGSVLFDGSANVNLDVSLPNYYDKTTADGKYALATNVYDKTTTDGKYALAANVYDKTTSDSKYALLSNTYLRSELYTKTEVNALVKTRVVTEVSNATPSINSDTTDMYGLTALDVNITNITVTGTPVNGQRLRMFIIGTAARTITWSASFEASLVALPTTTTSTNRIDIGFVWNAATSKWRCVAVA